MKEIVKNTLVNLSKSNRDSTPDNYFFAFYKEAKKLDIKIDECILYDTIVDNLTLNEKKSLAKENVRSFSSVSKLLLQRSEKLKNITYIFNEILAPSLSPEAFEEINSLNNLILENPQILFERETVKKIQNIVKKRIFEDRKILLNKSEDMSKITDLMGKYFDKTLITSGNSKKEIGDIKNDLDSLNISNSSNREFTILQAKLVDTIYNIENTMEKNQQELLDNQSNFNSLEEKIARLSKELKSAKDENSLDYLTKILNRKSFDIELEKIEQKHQMFQSKYAIVFYDIDHFKLVNDTYGHDCGDSVLRTFAALLNDLTRQEDILARYGGEEFVVLLNYDKDEEVLKYIRRIKEVVSSRDFIYKDQNLNLKFSAGLAFRIDNNNAMDTLKSADELLYKAKSTGRNKTVLADGAEV